MPLPFPITDNVDEHGTSDETVLISFASVCANNLNAVLPPLADNIDVQEQDHKQDPEFVLADVLDPNII